MAADVSALSNAIRSMDQVSQDGFMQIHAIARAARIALDAGGPGALKSFDVSEILAAIERTSFDSMNVINVQAEEVGCNYSKASACQ